MDSTIDMSAQHGAGDSAEGRSLFQRLPAYLLDQVLQIQPKIVLARMLLACLPRFTFGQIRTAVLRKVGFEIGKKTGFYGMPRIFGRGELAGRLKIGECCWINIDCHLDLSETITIGDNVGIGPGVMIMTGTHEMGTEQCRTGAYESFPVTIEDGVWLGARSTIMPGVTIGKGAVISAGAIVSRDVPANTIILGATMQGMPIEKWQKLTKQGGPGQ